MKKLLAAMALAVAFAFPALAAPTPTIHWDGTVCQPNPEMQIDSLLPALEKVRDQMPKGMHVEFVGGEALKTFDANQQAAGGPAKPDNIAELAFLLAPGWDDNGANVVQMLAFDSHGCFIGGKPVPSGFVTRGIGASA